VQLLNGALLAELHAWTVVVRLPQPRRGRRRPGRAAGAGLPRRRFRRPGQDVAVLNIGGIANLTLLPAPRAGDADSIADPAMC
jgi:anhydro-N-acetylmuramic acid kinase